MAIDTANGAVIGGISFAIGDQVDCSQGCEIAYLNGIAHMFFYSLDWCPDDTCTYDCSYTDVNGVFFSRTCSICCGYETYNRINYIAWNTGTSSISSYNIIGTTNFVLHALTQPSSSYVVLSMRDQTSNYKSTLISLTPLLTTKIQW